MQYKLQCNGTKQRISITNNGTKATKTKNSYATISHSRIIQCDSNKEYVWKIKCVKYKFTYSWSIGIHSADQNHADTAFDYKDLSYSYAANGTVWDCKNYTAGATSGWKSGDVLILRYSPKIKQLTLTINNKKQRHAITIKNNPKGYKMAMYLGYNGDCAELMDFTVIDDNDDNEEKKESRINSKEMKVIDVFFCVCSHLIFINK